LAEILVVGAILEHEVRQVGRDAGSKLGRSVDVVMDRSLSPYIREKVLRETMPL
jgi:predicted nucleotidyltransferase